MLRPVGTNTECAYEKNTYLPDSLFGVDYVRIRPKLHVLYCQGLVDLL